MIKGGAIAYAPMGDANASIPTPQPVMMRPMFAGCGRAAARRSLTFVSPLADVWARTWSRGVVAVKDTRGVTKADMPLNDACPDIRVDPDTFKVWIDGDEVVPDPAPRTPPRPALLAVLMDPLTLLLADSRFPSGSYAHSLGLEQAVADGLTRRPRVHPRPPALVAEADARFAVEARRARGVRELARLEIEWAARCPSPGCAPPRGGSARSCCARRRSIWDVPVPTRAAAAARARRGRRGRGRLRRGHGAARALRRRGDGRVAPR